MAAWLAALLLLPGPVRAGSALGGMGGVGTGIRDDSGELGDNPAASTAGVPIDAGAVHLGATWSRLAFAGYVYAPGVTTVAAFDAASPTDLAVVSPKGPAGRIAAGAWRAGHRALALEEPLDTALLLRPGDAAPLSARYLAGRTRVAVDEALDALGAVWIGELAGGDARIALGGAWMTDLARAAVTVNATRASDGSFARLRELEARRFLSGPGATAGLFYRPVPEGSLGVRASWEGELSGDLWEQDAGDVLRHDTVVRPSRVRAGLGGAVELFGGARLAVDLEYLADSTAGATLFAGTPAARYETDAADVTIQTRGGVEWPVRLPGGAVPLRAGFFLRQDPLPAPSTPAAAPAVMGFAVPAVRQDVTGWTLGAGWSGGGLRADLALAWLLVTTHVRQTGPTGAVQDLGDTRSGLEATGSVTLAFGAGGADARMTSR